MDESNSETFTITVDGNVSGTKWYGTFKSKKRLSHRDRLNQDKLKRELLGGDVKSADVDAYSIAEAISQISVRLTDAPSWWKESGNGLDLSDSNVVSEVYEKVMKVEKDAFDSLKKKAEEAEKALKEAPAEVK